MKYSSMNQLVIGFCLAALTLSPSAFGQQVEKAKVADRLGVALTGSHYYDIFRNGIQLNPNGYHKSDFKGMFGENAAFDMGVGLLVSYSYSSNVAFDFNFSSGSLSGSSTDENLYYSSKLSSYGLGMNLGLRNVKKYTPFLRVGLGQISSDATVNFVKDKFPVTKAEISEMYLSGGLGITYDITNKIQGILQTEFTHVNSDQMDANISGNGADQFVKTSIGIKYHIGNTVKLKNGVNDQNNFAPNSPSSSNGLNQNIVTEVVFVGDVTTLNNLVRLMNNNPNAVLNINIDSRSRSKRSIRQKFNQLVNYLQTNGINQSRVKTTFVSSENSSYGNSIFLKVSQ